MCCRRLHEVMDLLQNEVLLYHFQIKYSLFFIHMYTYIHIFVFYATIVPLATNGAVKLTVKTTVAIITSILRKSGLVLF